MLTKEPRINLLVYDLFSRDGIGADVLFQKNALEKSGYRCDIYSIGCDEETKNSRFYISELNCRAEDLIIMRLFPERFKSCLGVLFLESGQKRVPPPPAMITP